MVFFPPQNSLANWIQMNEVLRDKDVRSWILLNPTSLGDTWIVCALASAFKKKHGGPLTMVVGHSQVALAQMYNHDIDKIIQVDKNSLHDICSRVHHMSNFEKDRPLIAHPFWQGDGRLFELANLFRYAGRGGVTLSDLFRYILHLDWDAPLAEPVIPQAWRDEAAAYGESIGVIPGSSVILFPDNNTVEALPSTFWQPLSDELNRLGWSVFTNTVGNGNGPRTEIFSGTNPISVPIHLAIPLVETAGRFISTANGMAATLVGSKVRCQYAWITIHRERTRDICGVDPFISQSIRFSGFDCGTIPEYRVCPDVDMVPIANAIARHDLTHALPSGGYPLL